MPIYHVKPSLIIDHAPHVRNHSRPQPMLLDNEDVHMTKEAHPNRRQKKNSKEKAQKSHSTMLQHMAEVDLETQTYLVSSSCSIRVLRRYDEDKKR